MNRGLICQYIFQMFPAEAHIISNLPVQCVVEIDGILPLPRRDARGSLGLEGLIDPLKFVFILFKE